jgi:hypothetical protein
MPKAVLFANNVSAPKTVSFHRGTKDPNGRPEAC